jgi:hypothetical protein
VAERGDCDVDAGGLSAEGRQVGRDHHGRDIADAELSAADINAHTLQHRLDGLLGERDIVERVAGPVKTDH